MVIRGRFGYTVQPVETDSFQASGLASRFQESMNVHRGTGGSTAVKARSHQRPNQPPLSTALEKWTDRQ